ncbi:MAG: endolytic transglycosylase MltG [Caldisericia bacterium]|nr:endolytic transglycosylase MltG [Caldisericia bacterium]
MRYKNTIDIHSKKSRFKRNVLLTITIAGLLFFTGWMGFQWFHEGIHVAYHGPVSFSIEQGESLETIANKLHELDLIGNPDIFILYLRFHQVDAKVRSGDYEIEEGIQTIQELVSWLLQGQEKVYTYTIPEGWTINQIAMMLYQEEMIEDPLEFIELAKFNGGWFPFRFQEEVLESDSLEGYLYPETYYISKLSSIKLIEQMLQQYDSLIEENHLLRAQELGMTWTEIMTLASIIEKESVGSGEMSLVSSVFHNRLRDSWPLQSCATLEYAIPREGYVFTEEELKTDTPYNSYMYPGLPPTPICNPSLDAIKAALWPADTEYYFFVSKGDGTHAFSKSLEEHNRNVRKYIP